MGVHVWHFTEQDGKTRVRTEESWSGETVKQKAAETQEMPDASLKSRLNSLKTAAKNMGEG